MAEIVEGPKRFSFIVRETAKRILRHENAILGLVLIALIGGMGL